MVCIRLYCNSFIHEFGHYYVARINKVKVDIFSIGFGPSFLKYKDKNGTLWQLCIVPLGGYVKFAGEMYPDKAKSSVEENKKQGHKEFLFVI